MMHAACHRGIIDLRRRPFQNVLPRRHGSVAWLTGQILFALVLWIPISSYAGFAIEFIPSGTAAGDGVSQSPQEYSVGVVALRWMLDKQRRLHQELAEILSSLQSEKSIRTISALLVASFLYGIFHAAGPGHGKIVLTAYLGTRRQRIPRGIVIAIASSLCQACTAVVLVYGLIMVGGWVVSDVSAGIIWSERLSFMLIAILGAVLVVRALRELYRAYQGRTGSVLLQEGHCGCGHVHGTGTNPAEDAADFRTAVGTVVAVGLRPCSGGILVLIFAYLLGLPGAGVAAVFAMAVGTAITVSILALLAMKARAFAIMLAGLGGRGLWAVTGILSLLGGAILLWVGLTLFVGSFYSPSAFGFM